MVRSISLRSDKTGNGKVKTGKGIALMRLLKQKLRYIKRIINDRQQILGKMLRKIQYCMRFQRKKENSAYTERITEKDSGKCRRSVVFMPNGYSVCGKETCRKQRKETRILNCLVEKKRKPE